MVRLDDIQPGAEATSIAGELKKDPRLVESGLARVHAHRQEGRTAS